MLMRRSLARSIVHADSHLLWAANKQRKQRRDEKFYTTFFACKFILWSDCDSSNNVDDDDVEMGKRRGRRQQETESDESHQTST